MAEELVLTKTQLRAGVWEGVLTGAGETEPVLTFRQDAEILSGLEVSAGENGTWIVRAPIPADRISDDIQTFTIMAADDVTVLAHFAIFAGEAVDADLRAEVNLLRAELDLLKRAFRQHCSDTT